VQHATGSGIVYRGEGHDAVGQEIIIERGEIRATTLDKLQGGLHIQAQRIRALDGIDNAIRVLLDNASLS
jgi:hypothetical protein